jgi:hypothetical protein
MSHRAIYWIVGGAMAVLLAVMLITFSYNRYNQEAQAKAEELITNFDKAGLRAPKDPERVAKVFGTNGGPVCASVGSGVAVGIAKLNLSVGGAFYTRPVIADGRVVKGLLVVVQTYCPEKVPEVQDLIDSQRFENVIRP